MLLMAFRQKQRPGAVDSVTDPAQEVERGKGDVDAVMPHGKAAQAESEYAHRTDQIQHFDECGQAEQDGSGCKQSAA